MSSLSLSKKVIAYCLFYDNKIYACCGNEHEEAFIERYMTGLFEAVRTRDLYFPDWHIHITYDKTVFLNKEISRFFSIFKHLLMIIRNKIYQ